MSIITKLPQIIEESQKEYKEIKEAEYNLIEKYKESDNYFVKGDNLSFMKYLSDKQGKKIKLIYIDPPFFSKAKYGVEIKVPVNAAKKEKIKQIAYTDTWEFGLYEYLKMLTVRFYMMKEILADDGCIWVHLDWHVVHYVKIILDEIFGEKNFINEIIWQYKSGGSSKKHFSRKHDTLLFYAKSKKYYFKPIQEKSYNREFKPYRFKGVKEYKDELGWYTMVNMKDVWQIDMVGRTSKERTGYATQKPEALLSRIIECCTKEGDIVADFFGGSGTLAVTAWKKNRKFIHCDIGNLAIANAKKRFAKRGIPYNFYEQHEINKNEKNAFINEKEYEVDVGIDVQAEVLPIEKTDKKILKVDVLNYFMEDKVFDIVELKSRRTLIELNKINNLAFIDYVSIDYDFDNKIYKPDDFFWVACEDSNLSFMKTGSHFTEIGINIVDLFGKSTILKIVPTEGGNSDEENNKRESEKGMF